MLGEPYDSPGIVRFSSGYVFAMGNMYLFKFCSCEFDDNIIHTVCISSFADKWIPQTGQTLQQNFKFYFIQIQAVPFLHGSSPFTNIQLVAAKDILQAIMFVVF